MNTKRIFYKKNNIYLFILLWSVCLLLLLISTFYILNIKEKMSLMAEKQDEYNLNFNKDDLFNNKNNDLEKSFDVVAKKVFMEFLESEIKFLKNQITDNTNILMDLKQKKILETTNAEQQISDIKIVHAQEKDIFNKKINYLDDKLTNLNEFKNILSEQIKIKDNELEEQKKQIISLSTDNNDKKNINDNLVKTIEFLNNKIMNVVPLREEYISKTQIFNILVENIEDLKTHPLMKNKINDQHLKIAHYNAKEDLKDNLYAIKNPPSSLLFVFFDKGTRNGQHNVYTLKDLCRINNDDVFYMYVFWKKMLNEEQILKIDYLLELKNAGFSAEKLKNMGYSALELKEIGFSLKELKDIGFTVNDFRIYHEGLSVQELKNIGFSFMDMLLSDKGFFSYQELKTAGITIKDLKNKGFNDKYIMDNYGFSEKEIKEFYLQR